MSSVDTSGTSISSPRNSVFKCGLKRICRDRLLHRIFRTPGSMQNELMAGVEEIIEDPLEVLLQKHKKEKKELQGKIQSLKKSATKGDKKKKKEVQEEISKLELELSIKQSDEVEKLKAENEKVKEREVITTIENIEINEKPSVRVSKAQKRRDKKAAEQKEREKRIQEQEIENETGLRNTETQKIAEKLKKMALMIYDIQADGNCLYNAVDHQLSLPYGVKQLRLETGKHIKENSCDYLPFLSNFSTGEMLTEEEFDEYCTNIMNTTKWGGQIELRALSHVVKKPITVIQADGPPLVMGEEYAGSCESLIITYHRHMYQLGEHYNSVQPLIEEDTL